MSSIESALLRLNEFIERQLPTMKAPGLALGLAHRDQILRVNVYGLAIQEPGTPVTPKTLFQIGSTSKSVTSIVLQQSIGDILRERILEPLGMGSSTAVISSDTRSRLAVGYSPFYDDRPLPCTAQSAPATWLETDTADGSTCSNAEDMCKYQRVILQKGSGLLNRESFEPLVELLISTGEKTNLESYGLWLSSQQLDGYPIIGRSGGIVSFTADMLADLDHGMGVIVLTNGPAEVEKISHYALRLVRVAWNKGLSFLSTHLGRTICWSSLNPAFFASGRMLVRRSSSVSIL